MPDLTPNHPAVEAATFAQWSVQSESHWCPYADVSDVTKDRWRKGTALALTAALPNLTADDLRDTPAGQALIAEGRGWMPATERDRRALEILNDPTVPAATRHLLEKGMRLLHKLQKEIGR